MRGRHLAGAMPFQMDPELLAFCKAGKAQLPSLQWRSATCVWVGVDLSRWQALGFPWSWAEGADVWHRAPDTGKAWPQVFFALVPYRHGNPYGDARVVWEPSRLQQLVWLARVAQQAQGDLSKKAIKLARAELVGWVKANPPWTGVHYVSAMECGLRFIAICHALDMLRPHLALGDPIWKALAAILASHPEFIAKRISQHSSSGNHTVAEAASLVYAGVLFPEAKAASHWFEEGLNILCEEAERQVLPDGGGIEQSLHYHRFVVELFGLVENLLRYHELPTPRQLVAARTRGASFLTHMADGEGGLPSIGDSDNGYALSPDLAILRCDRPAGPYVRIFEHSGYTVIHRDPPDSVHLILDHGPFGMPPLYGHAHCDALALFMCVGGGPQLLDPGTYTYTGEKRLRAYFRSARAHNTVTVNARDPAKQESAFQWSGTFGARLVEKETAEGRPVRLLAMHDGYDRDGVTHCRYVAVVGEPMVVVVLDVLLGTGEHCLELNWHVPAQVMADKEGVFRTEYLILSVTGGDSALVIGDSTADPRGWRSPVYGRLEPAACISTYYHGTLPHEFVSILRVNDAMIDRPALDRELSQGRQWIKKLRNV